MKKVLKRTLAVFIAVIMTFGSAPLSGFVGLELPDWLDFSKLFEVKAEAATSGTCGDNLTWTLDTDTGVLEISGTGEMTNWTSPASVPWFGNRVKITSILLPEGLKSTGDFAFYECANVSAITIPNSVTYIGASFQECTGLIELTMPASAKISNCDGSFQNCINIERVTFTKGKGIMQNYLQIPSEYTEAYTFVGYTPWFKSSCPEIIIEEGVTNIGESAFQCCENLTYITIPDSVTNIGDRAFLDCIGLTDLYYTGSEEEWNAITFGSNNECLTNATIHYNYVVSDDKFHTVSWVVDGDVIKTQNFEYGSAVVAPADPTKEGYSFVGWVEPEGNIVTFPFMMTNENITFTALFEVPDTPSTPESERKTRVIVNKSALNYFVGEDIVLIVTEEENSGYYTPDKITLTNSDDSVAVFENIYSYSQFKGLNKFSDFEVPTEYRNSKFIVMTAKKSGMTAVTINDNTTEDTYTFPINVCVDDYVNLRADQIKTYDYKIPQLLVNDTYNAYYNGMYVADFSYEKVSGGWNFDMNIYNQTYVCGVVEVYDKTGNLVKVEIIDKYEGTGTGLLETLGTGWSMLTEAFKGDTFSFRGVSFSKETKIKDLFVPQDGYVRITNDSAVSTTCFVLNLFDLVLTGGSLVKDVYSFTDLEIKEIEKELLGRFVASEYYLKTASKFQEKLTDKVFVNISEASLSTVVATLSGEAEGLLMDIEIDFDDVVKSALGTVSGIGEGILTKYSDVFGYSLAVMFTAQKVLNYLVQLDHWKDTSENGNPFGFVTPIASSNNGTIYSGDGIGVDTNGNAPADIMVQSYRVLKGIMSIEIDSGNALNDYVAYDISLVKDGEIVQPDGTVTVYIPFPSEFEGSRIQVVRKNEDGTWSLIDSIVENGIITFEANHFCLFAIAPIKGVTETYTLSYNANGGSGAPSSQSGAENYIISSTKPSRSGYTFLGWSKSSSATSAKYEPGDSISLTSNTTLYAVWRANTYSVKYNANGGSGTMSNS
ncbi:MAG: leucine-rich repeat protein, partial [Clostridia bacterium]|nr:leucine-rich repeat protein [Clostridia bacterium]